MTDMTAGLAPAADGRAPWRRAWAWPRLRRRARCEGLRLAAGARDLARPCVLTLVVIMMTTMLSALFLLAPQIDLAVSAAFHQPGAGFPAASNELLRGLRRSSTWVMGAVLAATLIAAFGPAAWTAAWGEGRRRRAICLLAAFALGPGLVVNGLLKGFWGRARPINVEDFGGDAPFSAAWRLSDGCFSNCSFTSGEASSAAWTAITALALMPGPWRPFAGSAVVVYAVMLSMNRVAFGGHFLSDVILSWLLTLLAAIFVARTMRATPASRRTLAAAAPAPVAVTA